jgi:photosystem II stability/assembly factor-like uncharacterized protein
MLWPPAVCDSPRKFRAHRGVRCALEVCLLLGAALPSLGTSLDPLDRRAVTMAHPERGVLLSVVTVGHRLVAVGAAGIIIISDDFGSTWTQVPAPVSVTLTSVVFANERVGWAVGHSGVILGTQDSGATWTRQYDGREFIAALKSRVDSAEASASSETEELDSLRQMVDDGPDKVLFSLFAADANTVLTIGSYGLVMLTRDGGAHWQPRLDMAAAGKGKHLYAVRPLGDKLFFAGEGGALLWSAAIDAPLHPIPSPYAGTFFGLLTTSQRGLIAFGLRGHAVASTDEGRNWRSLDVGAADSINAGLRLSDGRIVLATESGDIFLSEDGVKPFRAVTTSAPSPYSDLTEIPHGIVAVGFRGAVHIALPEPRP